MKKSVTSLTSLLTIGILFLMIAPPPCNASESVVLVTGFEPFQNYTVNPSGLIAETLNGSSIGGASVVGVVLPVDFNRSAEIAIHAMKQYHPVLVLSLGLNARSHALRVEKIGVNLKRYQKENGRWSFPHRIERAGPFFRITSLHTDEIVRTIRKVNTPVQQSYFAGMYVCNGLFYQLLGYVHAQNSSTNVGFIHVPLLDSQDPQGMPLQTMVDAVKIAVQTSLQ